MKRWRKKEKEEFQIRLASRAMTVEGEEEGEEADQGEVGRDQDEVAQEADITIEGRNEDIDREVQTGKTVNWIPVTDRIVNGRKLRKLRSSGGGRGRRGELNMKVAARKMGEKSFDKIFCWGFLNKFLRKFESFRKIQKI